MSLPLNIIFWIVVLPGVVVVGLFAGWLVRKVSALVQYRVGPPVRQPLWDVLKLLGKETLIPEQAQRGVFFAAPLVAFASVLLLAVMLVRINLTGAPFAGDIIVAIYLMALPSLALILGSSASASPHAALGTSREMKLVMGYELPLALALVVIIIKTGGTISLADIASKAPVLSLSGLLAFAVSLLCIQAKLGFVPFDIAESETELAGGVLIEYSGALLGIWKLTQAVMLVAFPLFLTTVFLGGLGPNILAGLGKYVLVLVLIILIKNTNPRVRIDQAMKFFWLYCGVILFAAVALATIGNIYGLGWL